MASTSASLVAGPRDSTHPSSPSGRPFRLLPCSGYRPHGPIPCPPATVEPRAHEGEHLDHVPHQIDGGLARVSDDDPPAVRAERGFEVLDPEPGQTIAALHDHHTGRRVRQHSPQLGTLPVQPGPDLGHDLANLMPVGSSPRREASNLTVQVGTLIVRGHPRIQHHTTRRVTRGDVNPDRARLQPTCGHRHLVLTKPPIRGLWVDTAASCPLSQLHPLTKALVRSRLLTHRRTVQHPRPGWQLARTSASEYHPECNFGARIGSSSCPFPARPCSSPGPAAGSASRSPSARRQTAPTSPSSPRPLNRTLSCPARSTPPPRRSKRPAARRGRLSATSATGPSWLSPWPRRCSSSVGSTSASTTPRRSTWARSPRYRSSVST